MSDQHANPATETTASAPSWVLKLRPHLTDRERKQLAIEFENSANGLTCCALDALEAGIPIYGKKSLYAALFQVNSLLESAAALRDDRDWQY